MIERLGLLAFILIVWVLPGRAQAQARSDAAARPNIILFIVDDWGWQDTSVPFHTVRTPFNEFYRTPNMERLAAQGMIFTNAYAASPVCTPTRTSIMTGRYPARTHITDWTMYPDVEKQQRMRPWLSTRPPDWRVEGLQPRDTTLAELLHEAGYRTIHVGKAHFGALGTPGADPTNLGFEVNIAGHAAGSPESYYASDKYGNVKSPDLWGVPGLEEYYGTGTFLTEALTLEANEAIEDAVRDGEPFFVNMAHYAVHTPIMADSQYVGHYDESGPVEAAYASMIEGVDASLGALIEKLERLGVAENTLILVTSDNGGLSAHARGMTPMGTGQNTHNLPLRSGKGSAYEGGIRVPLIAAWAKRDPEAPAQQALPIPAGSETDVPVISPDLFPTILQVAGASVSEDYLVDGQSLAPLLTRSGGFDRGRALFWHYPHKWGPEGPGLNPFTAMRKGEWKLIYFYEDQRWELYNLANDLTETTNLVDAKPEVVTRMARRMLGWMQAVGAQRPISRATGEPVSWPKWPPAE